MRPRLLRDSRGVPSWTITMVAPGFFALTVKFLIGGLTIPVVGLMPPMSGMDYAMAVVAILGTWVAREYGDKKLENGTKSAPPPAAKGAQVGGA